MTDQLTYAVNFAAYEKAMNNYRKVSKEHNKVTMAYRKRLVDDAEFLASRARLDEASAITDKYEALVRG